MPIYFSYLVYIYFAVDENYKCYNSPCLITTYIYNTKIISDANLMIWSIFHQGTQENRKILSWALACAFVNKDIKYHVMFLFIELI